MEIAVWTQPDRIVKQDGVTYRKLKGAVCVGITTRHIRQKWVEICGDLCRPERRGGAYPFVFAKAVQAVWKPAWLEASLAVEHGELTPDQAWATMSKDLPDLGKDPRGEIPRIDTWMWSKQERRIFYICRVDLENEAIANQERYTLDGTLCGGYLNRVDYVSNIGLAFADVQDIDNAKLIVHPKLTTTLDADKVEPVCDPEDIIYPRALIP